MKVTEFQEAELKVQTQLMYDKGGVMNVLTCVDEMQQCELIILTKLNEILDKEAKSEEV